MDHNGESFSPYSSKIPQFFLGLIALLDPYLFKSCGYGPLTNLNTKHPPMFWFFSSFGPPRKKKKFDTWHLT